MPFDRPSLSDLRQQVATDINASLPGVDALLRFSNLGVLGDVVAAAVNGHYGYLDWIALNAVPFTATGEYLEGWAALKGVTRKPATGAIGAAVFAAADGATVVAGTMVNRIDGVGYVVTADAVAAGGTLTVQLRAVVAGAGGNGAEGVRLTLFAGIAGVTAIGSAAAALTGGADLESDADLRSRMLAAYAAPPQGGAITDYPSWALAVPGVTRAWVNPGSMGPGTLSVLFMMDDAQAAHGGFPQGANGCSRYEARGVAATGDQLAVADAIFPKQAVTALVYAVAPQPNALTLTLAGLSNSPPATRAAIATAVASALRVAAVPGGVTNISAIESAIAAVAGTPGFVLTKVEVTAGEVLNGAAGNIRSNPGALPILSAIAYV